MLSRLVWLLILVCVAKSASAEPLVIRGPTMGTTYHVKVVDADASDAAVIRAEVVAVLEDVDRRLSTYRADSEISRFNRAAAHEWFSVSATTAEIVAASLAMCRQTEGALDITVGPLVRIWHFGPTALSETGSTGDWAPPDDGALRAARALVGYGKLEVRLQPPALRKQVEGLELDLSAIGEGYAIDRIATALDKRGIRNYLIELGGEIRVGTANPVDKPWRVAIARPTSEAAMQTVVELSNGAVATSGDYGRYFEHRGRRYSHIIDPKTGRPIQHALAAVTVAADDALAADAWDTALLVLGPQRGYELAVEQKVAALFISREGDSVGTRETPAWQARFSTAGSSTPAEPQTRSP